MKNKIKFFLWMLLSVAILYAALAVFIHFFPTPDALSWPFKALVHAIYEVLTWIAR